MSAQQLECVICFQETSTPSTLLCSHSFCQNCIDCWLAISNKCPLCVRIVSDTAEFKYQDQEQILPVLDFSQSLRFVESRLADVRRRVLMKCNSSQNVKSNVSKTDAEEFYQELQGLEELFGVVAGMVHDHNPNSNSSEMVTAIESLNFKLLDLENMLEIGYIMRKEDRRDQCSIEDDSDDSYTDEQEEMEKANKKKQKCSKNKPKKSIK